MFAKTWRQPPKYIGWLNIYSLINFNDEYSLPWKILIM